MPGVPRVAQHAGDDPVRDENPDEEALELAEENLARADALAFFELIPTVGRELLRRFLSRESIRSGSEPASTTSPDWLCHPSLLGCPALGGRWVRRRRRRIRRLGLGGWFFRRRRGRRAKA